MATIITQSMSHGSLPVTSLTVGDVSLNAINNTLGAISGRIRYLDADGNYKNASTLGDTRWAVGNLNGVYGYQTDTPGAAFGVPDGSWLKIDPVNGVRIGFGATTKIQLDGSGNATFSGSMSATSGTVGGFTIGATELYAGTGATRVEMQSTVGFWAGADTLAAAPFSVSPAGALKATSGAVGGWTLGATSLVAGSGANTVGLDSAGVNPAIYAGSATPASAPFRVTQAGAVTATNITATGGTVGGWTLSASELVGPSGTAIRSGQTAYNTGTGFFLGNVASTPKFSLGDPAGNNLTWDGTTLSINGAAITAATIAGTFANGSAAAPSITFTNSLGSGLFRAGTDIIGIATAGVERMRVNAASGAAGKALEIAGTSNDVTLYGHLAVEGVTSTGATGSGKFVFDASPTITGHATIEGVTATGATGSGKFVFATSPTLGGSAGFRQDNGTFFVGTVTAKTGTSGRYGVIGLGDAGTVRTQFGVYDAAAAGGGIDLLLRADGGIGFGGGNSAMSAANQLYINTSGMTLPGATWTYDLGAEATRWRSIYAGELRVQTLIARSVISTIGGNILTAPTTKIAVAVGTGDTSIQLEHNDAVSGDRIFLQTAPGGAQQFEAMAITSAPSGAGPYTYSVTRNLDGTGANAWAVGDAVVNTRTTGKGWIDQYSTTGFGGIGTGPTIVGNIRNSATWNDYSPRWAIGNLNGLYGYVADTYGCAFGVPTAAWVKIDPTNGVRLGYNATTNVQVDASGNATFSGDVTTGNLTATGGAIAGWTISATELVAPSGSYIRSGQTAYNTGTGFFLGNVGGTPKLSVGNSSANNYFGWDGSAFNLRMVNVWVSDDFGAGVGGVSVSGTTAELRVSTGVGGSNAGGLKYANSGPTLYSVGSVVNLDAGAGGKISLLSVPQFGVVSTGAGSAALGSNCPAVTATAPYAWLKALSTDGSTVYVPCWK